MGKFIVSAKWLKESEKKGEWENAIHFIISDQNAEKQYRFSLEKSIFASRKLKLLSKYNFVLTDNIKPTPFEFNQIIKSSGGSVYISFYLFKIILLFINLILIII